MFLVSCCSSMVFAISVTSLQFFFIASRVHFGTFRPGSIISSLFSTKNAPFTSASILTCGPRLGAIQVIRLVTFRIVVDRFLMKSRSALAAAFAGGFGASSVELMHIRPTLRGGKGSCSQCSSGLHIPGTRSPMLTRLAEV